MFTILKNRKKLPTEKGLKNCQRSVIFKHMGPSTEVCHVDKYFTSITMYHNSYV